MNEIKTDQNQMEVIQYITDTLPVSYCYDHYDTLMNNEVPFHWHNEFELLLVTNGAIECHSLHKNGTKIKQQIKTGEGAFFNTKALHYMKSLAPGTESRTFSFADNFFNFQPSGSIYRDIIKPIADSPLPGVFLTQESSAGRQLLASIQNFYTVEVSDPCWELYCIETICSAWRYLLTLFSHAEKSVTLPASGDEVRETRLWSMISFIHENYNHDITISDICNSASISKSECFRCFESIIKQTPVDYLNDYRLGRAASLLIETNRPVAAIAEECGFNSASYFGSVFRKKFSISPGQYRTKFETTRVLL